MGCSASCETIPNQHSTGRKYTARPRTTQPDSSKRAESNRDKQGKKNIEDVGKSRNDSVENTRVQMRQCFEPDPETDCIDSDDLGNITEIEMTPKRFSNLSITEVCIKCIARFYIEQICEYECQILPEMLASAYLTYLQ